MKNRKPKTANRKPQTLVFILLLSFLWLLLPQARAFAATYYLDINGVGEDGILGTVDDVISSDANPGTSEQPWKTLNRAYTWYSGTGTKVQEGDTVLFRNGNYGQFRESTVDGAQYHFHRTNWVTYENAPGHTPNLTSISVKNLGAGSNGESYLKFKGMSIANVASAKNTNYIYFLNCSISAAPDANVVGTHSPYYPANAAALYTFDVNYLTIQDCNIHQTGMGITASGSGWLIDHCMIHDITSDAINLGISDSVVQDCNIYDCDATGAPGVLTGTIDANGGGGFQKYEPIHQQGTGATGQYCKQDGSIKISYWWTNDTLFTAGGGLVVGETSGATITPTATDFEHIDGIQSQNNHNTIIRRNIFHLGGGQGIKIANGSNDIDIENNVIYATNDWSMLLSGLTDCNIYNNTCYDNIRFTSESGTVSTNIRLYNNICKLSISSGWANITQHGNNIFGNNPITGPTQAYPFSPNETELVNYDINSLFVDPANNDFHLKASSAAINFGDPAYTLATDIEGNPRDAQPDAGAYEYGASTLLYGDVSGDGEISAYDAALTAQAAVGLITLTPEQITAADVSGDGEVTAYDAALIAQRAVGLIDKFPVE